MGDNTNSWSAAEIDTASRLWRAGNSATRIAAMLDAEFETGRTRSAVLGYAHRHPGDFPARGASTSLSGRPKGSQTARPETHQPHVPGRVRHSGPDYLPGRVFVHTIDGYEPDGRALAAIAPRPAPRFATGEDPALYDAGSRRIPLVDLEPGDCRFAVNEAGPATAEPHLFCGHPAEPGKPYCAHHMARACSGEVAIGSRQSAVDVPAEGRGSDRSPPDFSGALPERRSERTARARGMEERGLT